MSLTSLSGSCTELKNIGKIGRPNGRIRGLHWVHLPEEDLLWRSTSRSLRRIYFRFWRSACRVENNFKYLLKRKDQKSAGSFAHEWRLRVRVED